MYVCICHGVTDREIREAAACGAEGFEELASMTGCGGSCGCCKELALQIMDEAQLLGLPIAA